MVKDGTLVIAQINEKVGPLDRGMRYEEPLGEALAAHKIGQLGGGGTMLSDDGEIVFADVEVEVTGDLDDAIRRLKALLEALGAPAGSKIIVGDEEHPVGVAEGLGLYLNGTDLPDEVYETCDMDVVLDTLVQSLGSLGEIRGDWQGPTESAVYMYGSSFEAMRDAVKPFVDSYPLCRKARVVRIA